MSEPEFKRRKFTITKEQDQELVELAESHHGGNVSMAIRAAVNQHRNSLDSNYHNAQILSQLQQQLHQLDEKITQTNTVDNGGETTRETHQLRSTDGPIRDGDPLQRAILNEFHTAECSLRFDDLCERIDAEPDAIQATLGILLDLRVVEQIPGASGRYRLLNDQPTRKPAP